MNQKNKDIKKQKFLYKLSIFKKINAITSLVSTLLIIVHGGYDAFWMFFRDKIPTLPKVISILLIISVLIHIVLSIIIVISGIKNNKGKKEKIYKKQNIRTILQRIFAVVTMLLIPLHSIGMSNRLSPKLLHAIVHPIFFIAVYGHVAVSTSKAFITLGIGNTKFIKVIDIVMSIILLFIFLASLNGLYWIMYGSWQG